MKGILELNEDVNTVKHGDFSEADLEKKNIYPLAIINPISASLDNKQFNEFTFEVGVLDQRDLSNDLTSDKFDTNSNEIDNLNTCHAVLNDLVTRIRNLYNEHNIELSSASSLTPILFSDKNILDGWSITIVLQIPNITISTC
jgi:hypothetical protein